MEDLMRKDENVVVVGADLNKPDGVIGLKDEFPDRVINVGIAEQNMAGIGAGLSAYGLMPFINTFCAFATRRICDQAAVSICYAERNVKIIGTDPGIAAEYNGGTHMTFEDIGVMRSIPNIVIVEPADAVELKQMIPSIAEYDGPVYMRLYRKKIENVHSDDYKYELGRADTIRAGNDATVISSGIMVIEALKAANELSAKGVDIEVINIHTIKPIDRKAIIASAQKTGVVITAENHNILGGLRSAVSEVLTEEYPVRVYPVGINNLKGEVGKFAELRERFGLTSAAIVSAVEKALSEKAYADRQRR
jgi:transketolase